MPDGRLPLAREIMQAHGGSLTCRAGSGGGRFVMTLPLVHPSSEGQA